MNVVLAIYGREAIPVRALPFVSGREPFTHEPRLSAHIVALAASQPDSRLLPGPVDSTMRTYQFEQGRPPTSVSPSQWGVVVEQIEEATDEGETALIRLLPDSVFVWLDEFEVWYLKLKGPEGSGEICLTPIVPSEMRQVVLEGFPSQRDAQEGDAVTIDYSPYLNVCEDGRIWWPLELALKLGAGYVPAGDDGQNLNPPLRAPNGRAQANERELLAAFHSQYSRLSLPTPLERDDGRFVDAAEFLDWLGQYVAQNQAHIEYPNSLAGAVREALRQARSTSDKPASEEADDRFAMRQFLDGFEKADRRIKGLPPVEAKIGPSCISPERSRELACKPTLNVADWIELTGIGEGHFGFYIVSKSGVRFREWEDEFIRTFPAKDQMEMRRNNEAVPLLFSCTPAELLAFVDTADLGGLHFEVSDDFRRAVGAAKQQRSEQPEEPPAAIEAKPPTFNENRPAAYATTERICEAFPHPKSVSPSRWANGSYLSDPPEWLRYARMSPGKPGVSALWNPAQFAVCMVSKGHIGKAHAAVIIRREFADWLEGWETSADYLP